MKASSKGQNRKKDENLFGLLSSYKANNTYVKVLLSESDELISIQLTGNPANWKRITDEKYDNFRKLRRLEIGSPKLSIKFLSPGQLVRILGPQLNIKIPVEKVKIINRIEDEGYYILEAPLKYRKKILMGMNKILSLRPQKKYEIIEKCIAEEQE